MKALKPNPDPLTYWLPGLVLVGGAAASAVMLWRLRATERDEVDDALAAAPASTVPSSVSGVTINSGVKLNDTLVAFLRDLRAKLDFNITVTSGIRDAWSQARAMEGNYNNHGGSSGGGRSYLEGLYRSWGGAAADALERGGVAALAALVQERIDTGKETKGHLAGRGLDFRVSDLTSAQRSRLMAAGQELGVEVLDEGNHIHMDHIGSVTTQLLQVAHTAGKSVLGDEPDTTKAVRKTIPIVISAIVGVGVLGGVWWLSFRPKS